MDRQLIRTTVNSILRETVANLPIRVVVRKWWELAAEKGELASMDLIGQMSDFSYSDKGKCLGLKVPKSAANEVFDSLTKETKTWVLKHWRTEEYFAEMISGVHLGIVKSYPSNDRAIGRKKGRTSISDGTWNEDKKEWIGGCRGYLTMKSRYDRPSFWRQAFFNKDPFPSDTSLVQEFEFNREKWKQEGVNDLQSQDSVLFHEFQHWFQEAVYYADERLKKPTRGNKSGWTEPKGFRENIRPIPRALQIILEHVTFGVDFKNPRRHPIWQQLDMYPVTDAAGIESSLMQPDQDKNKVGSVQPIQAWGIDNKDSESDPWIEKFFEETLKIRLSDYGWKEFWDYGYRHMNPLSPVHNFLWFSEQKLKDNDPFDREWGDTRKNSLQDKLRVANMYVDIHLVPKSHIVKDTLGKTNEIKPKKIPVLATRKQMAREPAYIIFSITQRDWKNRHQYTQNPQNIASSDFERWRSPLGPSWNKEWDERWVEYDAESRNYLAGIVKSHIEDDGKFQRKAVLSDAEFCASILLHRIKRKLKAGGRINYRIVDQNEKELVSMTNRIADRVIEVVEKYDIDWYKDNNPSGYDPINSKAIADETMHAWLADQYGFSRSSWGGYWRFIHDKVIGAV